MKREMKKRESSGPQKAGPFHPPPSPSEPQDKPASNISPEDNGRPLFKKDDGPRKKRIETPKSNPGVAEMMIWAEASFDKISTIVNEAFIASSEKKNLRQLTKAEINNLEQLKVDIFTNLDMLQKVDNTTIVAKIKENSRTPKSFANMIKEKNLSVDMGIDLFRKNIICLYIESKMP